MSCIVRCKFAITSVSLNKILVTVQSSYRQPEVGMKFEHHYRKFNLADDSKALIIITVAVL